MNINDVTVTDANKAYVESLSPTELVFWKQYRDGILMIFPLDKLNDTNIITQTIEMAENSATKIFEAVKSQISYQISQQ